MIVPEEVVQGLKSHMKSEGQQVSMPEMMV
jgi:hypothetical protein